MPIQYKVIEKKVNNGPWTAYNADNLDQDQLQQPDILLSSESDEDYEQQQSSDGSHSTAPTGAVESDSPSSLTPIIPSVSSSSFIARDNPIIGLNLDPDVTLAEQSAVAQLQLQAAVVETNDEVDRPTPTLQLSEGPLLHNEHKSELANRPTLITIADDGFEEEEAKSLPQPLQCPINSVVADVPEKKDTVSSNFTQPIQSDIGDRIVPIIEQPQLPSFEPNDPALFCDKRITTEIIQLLVNSPCQPDIDYIFKKTNNNRLFV